MRNCDLKTLTQRLKAVCDEVDKVISDTKDDMRENSLFLDKYWYMDGDVGAKKRKYGVELTKLYEQLKKTEYKLIEFRPWDK